MDGGCGSKLFSPWVSGKNWENRCAAIYMTQRVYCRRYRYANSDEQKKTRGVFGRRKRDPLPLTHRSMLLVFQTHIWCGACVRGFVRLFLHAHVFVSSEISSPSFSVFFRTLSFLFSPESFSLDGFDLCRVFRGQAASPLPLETTEANA